LSLCCAFTFTKEDGRESQEETFKDRKKKGFFSPKLIRRNQSMRLKAEKYSVRTQHL